MRTCKASRASGRELRGPRNGPGKKIAIKEIFLPLLPLWVAVWSDECNDRRMECTEKINSGHLGFTQIKNIQERLWRKGPDSKMMLAAMDCV